jgi:hypothetical protein
VSAANPGDDWLGCGPLNRAQAVHAIMMVHSSTLPAGAQECMHGLQLHFSQGSHVLLFCKLVVGTPQLYEA